MHTNFNNFFTVATRNVWHGEVKLPLPPHQYSVTTLPSKTINKWSNSYTAAVFNVPAMTQYHSVTDGRTNSKYHHHATHCIASHEWNGPHYNLSNTEVMATYSEWLEWSMRGPDSTARLLADVVAFHHSLLPLGQALSVTHTHLHSPVLMYYWAGNRLNRRK